MNRDVELERYEKEVGHPPRTLHPDDPDWSYGGSPSERKALSKSIGIRDRDEPMEGQESLFDV